MTDSMQAITWGLATTIGICTILGLAVRMVLLPYLREHLIQPVQRTEHQVTANHHSSQTPTVPDRIDDVLSEVRTLRERLETVATEQADERRLAETDRSALARHLVWSDEEVSRIWSAIRRRPTT